MTLRSWLACAVTSTALLTAITVSAAPVTGTIGFGGPGSPITGDGTFSNATGVDFTGAWGVTQVTTGSFAPVPMFFNPVTFSDIVWGADVGAVNVALAQTIWTFEHNSITYELTAGTVDFITRGALPGDNSISVTGSGTLRVEGFDDTAGVWNFTGGFAGTAPNLSFSAGATDVPEPGTMALVGLALLGLHVGARRKLPN